MEKIGVTNTPFHLEAPCGLGGMSPCTAPVKGHRSAAAAAAASYPQCGYRSSGYSRSSYSSYAPPVPSHHSSGSAYDGGGSSGGSSSGGRRSGRTQAGGSVTYSPTEWWPIEPVVRKAAELCNSLESSGGSAWYGEKVVPLGTLLSREIDKGLGNSRIGIVLVSPARLKSIEQESVAEKELSATLATDRVIPVAHWTTFEALRELSPLLASRSGLSTADSSLAEVAAKVAAAGALGDIDAWQTAPALSCEQTQVLDRRLSVTRHLLLTSAQWNVLRRTYIAWRVLQR